MDLAPPIVAPTTTCDELVRLMREQPTSSVLISAGDGRVQGIVTEQDVARKLAYRIPGVTRVEDITRARDTGRRLLVSCRRYHAPA
jgi:CBS domain-containing protein